MSALRALTTLALLVPLAMPTPSSGSESEIVARDARAADVLVLGGTVLYRRVRVPERRAWMRLVDGQLLRAHHVPAGAIRSAIGRSRDGRVIVTMVVERRRRGLRVGAAWWIYDVARDRARVVTGLPGGRCAPTAVSIWRGTLAYAVECGAGSRAGVFVRKGGHARRVAPVQWSRGWHVSLSLRGSTLAAFRDIGDSVEVDRVAVGLRACRTRIDGLDLEDWYVFGPWQARGTLMWWVQARYPEIGQPAALAIVGSRLAGTCTSPGPIGAFELGELPQLARGASVDGRWLYWTDADGIRRQRLSSRPRSDAPPNDDFANATPLPGAVPISVTAMIGPATAEDGEPDIDPGTGSVWFVFRPDATQSVRVSSPTAQIFTGTKLRTLRRVGEPDPYDPFAQQLEAVAGTSYWIRLISGTESTCFVPTGLTIGVPPVQP